LRKLSSCADRLAPPRGQARFRLDQIGSQAIPFLQKCLVFSRKRRRDSHVSAAGRANQRLLIPLRFAE
jgi:hypothetical protein